MRDFYLSPERAKVLLDDILSPAEHGEAVKALRAYLAKESTDSVVRASNELAKLDDQMQHRIRQIRP